MSTQRTDRFYGVTGGLAVKAPCVTAATTNIALSGEQTINSISLVAGQRVLVMGQTNPVENGIYEVSTTDWRRTADFDGQRDASQGSMVIVTDAGAAVPAPLPSSAPYYAITPAEVAAGLAEISGVAGQVAYTTFEPGDVRRYGAVAGEAATVTSSVNTAAIQAALDSNGYVWFQPGETYMHGTLLPQSNTIIDLNGATSMMLAEQLDGSTNFRISPVDYQQNTGTTYPYYNADLTRENITIRNGIIDGNRSRQYGHNQTYDGTSTCQHRPSTYNPGGDHGFACVYVGHDSHRIRLENLDLREAYTDGLLTREVDDVEPTDLQVVNCDMYKNTRQGCSQVGGSNQNFTRCRFRDTAAFATMDGGVSGAGPYTFTILPTDDIDMFQIDKQVNLEMDDGTRFYPVITNVSGLNITVSATQPKDGGVPSGAFLPDREVGCTHFPVGPMAGFDLEPYFDVNELRFTDCVFSGNGGRGFTMYMYGSYNAVGEEPDVDGLYFENCRVEGNLRVFEGEEAMTFTLGEYSIGRNIMLSNVVVDGAVAIQPPSKNVAKYDFTAVNCNFRNDGEYRTGAAMIVRGWLPGSRGRFVNCHFAGNSDNINAGCLNIAAINGGAPAETTDQVVFEFDGCTVDALAGANSQALYMGDGSGTCTLKFRGTTLRANYRGIVLLGYGHTDLSFDAGSEIDSGDEAIWLYSSQNKLNAWTNINNSGGYSVGEDTFVVDVSSAYFVGDIFAVDDASASGVFYSKVIDVYSKYGDTEKWVQTEDVCPAAIADNAQCYRIYGPTTQLNANHTSPDTVLTIDSNENFFDGDAIGITYDDGTQLATTVVSSTATTITVADALTKAASDGRPLYKLTNPQVRFGDAVLRNQAAGSAVVYGQSSGGGIYGLGVSFNTRFINCAITKTLGLTMVSQLSGAGVPTLQAGRGSIYQRTDGAGEVYRNSSAAAYGTTWTAM